MYLFTYIYIYICSLMHGSSQSPRISNRDAKNTRTYSPYTELNSRKSI